MVQNQAEVAVHLEACLPETVSTVMSSMLDLEEHQMDFAGHLEAGAYLQKHLDCPSFVLHH